MIEAGAAERARWLQELADALDEARRLMKRLATAGVQVEAAELCARIEAARIEVEVLKLRAAAAIGAKADPQWSDPLPWRQSLE